MPAHKCVVHPRVNIVLPAGERCDRIGQSMRKTKRTIKNMDPLLQPVLSGHPLHISPCSQLWQGTAEESIHRQLSSELQHGAILAPQEARPGAEGQNPPFRSALLPISTKELQELPESSCNSTFWVLGFATTPLSLTLSICMLLPILFFSREQPTSISSRKGLENRRGQGDAGSTSLFSYWKEEVGRPPPAGTLSPERSRPGGGWGSTGERRGVVPSLRNPDGKELCPG